MDQDFELVKQCLAGIPSAQKMLYDKFSPKMLGVCYRYMHSMQEAEDVLQETFIKVFKHLKDFKNEGSLEGWVRRITVNTALNHIKKNKRIAQELEIDNAHQLQSNVQVDLSNYDTKLLMDIMHKMPDGYKVIMNLFAIEGYSHKEIADQLGIAEGTSRSQFLRAKIYFKKSLEKHNYPISEVIKAAS